MSRGRENSPYTIIVLFGFVVCCVLLFKPPDILKIAFTNHSLESHSVHVGDIEHCFNSGDKSKWFLQPSGRYAQYCMENNQKYVFWRISSCEGSERVIVTQFKQEVKKLTRYILSKEMVETAPPPCS